MLSEAGLFELTFYCLYGAYSLPSVTRAKIPGSQTLGTRPRHWGNSVQSLPGWLENLWSELGGKRPPEGSWGGQPSREEAVQTGLGRQSSLCDCRRQRDRGWEGGLGPVLPSKGLGFSFKANGGMVPSQLSASLSLLPPPSLIHSIVSICFLFLFF